jgi:Lon protease-like protein
MFPLGTVLVPGAFLPLHVFEPRYRALVEACLQGTPEFGVALIERGFEVGGGDARFDVGCVARIVEAVPFPDGRWALGTVGDRRIRIDRWLPDAPYPRAEVTDWPDPPAGPAAAERIGGLVADLRRVLALAAEVGDAAHPATVEVADDPAVALWQVAALAPLGPMDRLDVLRSPTPDERLDLLVRLLDDAGTMLAARVAGG